MQSGKCCYCEERIPPTGHLKAVEHFQPKSVFKGLELEWTNLLLVCAQCNGAKSNKFPVVLTGDSAVETVVFLEKETDGFEPLLLDPSDPEDDDPEEHVTFEADDRSDLWGFAYPRNGSRRGTFTLETVGLYKSYYLERRRSHSLYLDSIYRRFLDAYKDAHLTGRVEMLGSVYKELKNMTDETSEFASFSRKYLQEKRVEERFEKLIQDLK